MKYYAVKEGRTPGIYETWSECQEQINKYPGAVYKGFKTREEAETFLTTTQTQPTSIPTPHISHVAPIEDLKETEVIAYVDGSYDFSTNFFSYGMVLFDKGKELHFSEKFVDSELAAMNNVAGEIKGAEAAMQYCLDNNLTSITIFHDYEGIAKWCTGEWKAKKAGTMAYRDYYKKASVKVNVYFRKVKGHSGNKYNELADKLAKEALGI